MNTDKHDQIIGNAYGFFDQGNYHEAKKIIQSLLKKNEEDSEALNLMGMIYKNQGKIQEAEDTFLSIIEKDDEFENAYFNLGGLKIDSNELEQAIVYFNKVIELNPSYDTAYFNIGVVKANQGKIKESISYYEKASDINPQFTSAAYNMGISYQEIGMYEEAKKAMDRVLSISPRNIDALFSKAMSSQNMGDIEKAIQYNNEVVEIDPEYYLAYNNLGLLYLSINNFEKALSCFERCLDINPKYPAAYMNMGNVYRNIGNMDKTIESYKKSIELEPSLVAYNNLGGYLKELNNYEEAYRITLKMLEYENLKKSDLASIHDTYIQICKWDEASKVIERFKITKMDPDEKDVVAGSLMEFCAITDLTVDEIADYHKEWGKLTVDLIKTPYDHAERFDDYKKSQKIRIGYLSPDLREHSVGYLIKDIITSHNRELFEIYCYANFDPSSADHFTQEMINHSDMFKYTKHLTDFEMADEIYRDNIHMVIELAGHTAGHRLRSCAYKPAPIQITYLGYPNTTGLPNMDYRITDQYAETTPDKDYRYSEDLIRLTNCFLTFKGFENVYPDEVSEKTDDKIIFGCFNNIQKLTPEAVKLWSEILKRYENSELHLKAKQLNTPFVWENITDEFKKYGIGKERLICLGYTPTREEHLKLYNKIDIALDTFPYNGTVTTLEALWMNIPVVTLVGESHAQRVGYSILKNLGLDTLIAETPQDYIDLAVSLAEKPEKIVELKKHMRKNLIASSICNPEVFTRELELRLRKIWKDFIENDGKKSVPEITSVQEGNTALHEAPSGDSVGKAIVSASNLRMAMVKLKTGEYKKAIEISTHLVGEPGISSLAWYVMGVSYFRLNETELAIEALINSLKQNDANIGAWKTLGEVYITIGDIEGANECLKQIYMVEKSA